MSENLGNESPKLPDRDGENPDTRAENDSFPTFRSESKSSNENDFTTLSDGTTSKHDEITSIRSDFFGDKQSERTYSYETLSFSMHLQSIASTSRSSLQKTETSGSGALSRKSTKEQLDQKEPQDQKEQLDQKEQQDQKDQEQLDPEEQLDQKEQLDQEEQSEEKVQSEEQSTYQDDSSRPSASLGDFQMIRIAGLSRRFTLSTIRDVRGSLGMEIYQEDTSRLHVASVSESPQAEKRCSIDRDLYTRLFEVYEKKNKKLETKNLWLQSKMTSYFLRRKMFYVLKETSSSEVHSKYDRDLEILGDFIERADREKDFLKDELNAFRNKRDAKNQLLNETFDKLQTLESEFGQGLTFLKTGRQNMPAFTANYIKRQRIHLAELVKMRLKFILLRNLYNDTMAALDELERFLPKFTLMDYVQLKHDNRQLTERFEEKVHDLEKTRKCLQNASQILAHARERICIVDLDVQSYSDRLEELNIDVRDLRQNIGYMKTERSRLRKEVRQATFNYGLLTKPKMLQDMELTTAQINKIKREIEKTKRSVKAQAIRVKALKMNKEIYVRNRERRRLRKTMLLEKKQT